ncbi:hypothetical protein G0Q06_09980 [Puniceicoccales bacterium CK1056]|uniref:Uncharacterized protein n=1 Tax=Oceanipulchritudo coccoides TaxID=2706888 RepID=A0A6B2M3J6_9BACT|nr:hypothetical protein [Oceanipulchritudo coccoides]NDV62779.1 hypothetical protein [Oceanipulchritudo coccoides]
MNRSRIIEIIESYRPGEGLEADPEVKEALELAAKDPELEALRRDVQLFDEAFGEIVRDIPVPDSLCADILAKAAEVGTPRPADSGSRGKIINWFHPFAFAAAAAIVLLLALSFTFWNPPEGGPVPAELAQSDSVAETAQVLYANLNPSFRSRNGEKIRDYLQSQGGILPASMPSGFVWDNSFACDVIEIGDKRVSVVCFSAPDGSDKLHLFTFYRNDFPGTQIPQVPLLQRAGKACSATWGDEEQIHVLYADSGDEENLRRLLDI